MANAKAARLGWMSVWIAACGMILGCGRGEDLSPEATVTAFVSAMEAAQSDPAERVRAYGFLSASARESLTARAQRASQVSGWELQSWEMLAPDRWRPRMAVDPDSVVTRVDGSRAVVTVHGRGGRVANVPLVRENGVWKMDLALPAMEAIRPGDTPPGHPGL